MIDEASRFSPPIAVAKSGATVATSPRSPYVAVVAGARGTSTFELATGRAYALGRRLDSDIVLDDPAAAEDHAILFGGDPPQLVDLGSPGGTTLGGRVLEPHARHALEGTNVLAIGSLTVVVRRAGAPSAPEETRAARESARVRAAKAEGPLCVTVGGGHELVTRNARMRELLERVQQVARTDVSVLLLGETGVGKEVIARAIHHFSPRRAHRLVTVNCAAIPENLMESELFGYERGAFSGAVSAKPGLFEAADGGTLLLDEVAELPKGLQAKLLRVLETGEVLRVGAVHANRVHVRVIAATNRDIAAEIAAGAFRADLYYRLNGMSLTIPPLRERAEDVPILAAHFARRVAGEDGARFSAAALAALQAHPWTGNVRELRAVVERALVLAHGEAVVGTRHLMFDAPMSTSAPTTAPPESGDGPAASARRRTSRPPASGSFSVARGGDFAAQEASTGAVAAELKAELARREQKKIRAALAQAGGNQTDAAKILGVSRRTLINRIERYAIERPRKKSDGDR